MNSNQTRQEAPTLAKKPDHTRQSTGIDPATGEAGGSPERPNTPNPPTTLQLATMERDEAVASMMRWKGRQSILTEQLRITEQVLERTRLRLEFADNTLAAVKRVTKKFPVAGIKSQYLNRTG